MFNINFRVFILSIINLLLLARPLQASEVVKHKPQIIQDINSDYSYLDNLYKHLHAHPELTFMETKTSRRIAEELKKAGFEVTEKIGGNGVVGVLKNGDGPTIMIRADMDGLPIKEKTGLPYASKDQVLNHKGQILPSMHACGHDVHMSVFIGTARLLQKHKNKWKGNLLMVAQPAEEMGAGAKRMIKDGIFTRFPKPTYALSLHADSGLPAGSVGITEGYAMANVDEFEIIVKGVSAHGAYPQLSKDPIVLASQIVLALQTIVSRETPPGEPAVMTIGAIHGGTKNNIIPSEVELKANIRSYGDETRNRMLASIKRIIEHQALSAGLPENLLPEIRMDEDFAPALYNDPALAKQITNIFKEWLGEDKVINKKPSLAGEDFGQFGRTPEKIPICFFWLGSVNKKLFQESQETGKSLPSLHSEFYAPDPEPTIKTGVLAMSSIVIDLSN